jgi:hypothetical protein
MFFLVGQISFASPQKEGRKDDKRGGCWPIFFWTKKEKKLKKGKPKKWLKKYRMFFLRKI